MAEFCIFAGLRASGFEFGAYTTKCVRKQHRHRSAETNPNARKSNKQTNNKSKPKIHGKKPTKNIRTEMQKTQPINKHRTTQNQDTKNNTNKTQKQIFGHVLVCGPTVLRRIITFPRGILDQISVAHRMPLSSWKG